MKSPQSPRAWLCLALVSIFLAVPAFADPDPVSQINMLFGQVSAVAAANDFTQGERNSLLTKLIGASAALDRGQENTAGNNLGAFAHEVRAMEQSGRLTPAEAEPLINAANSVIDQL